MIIIIGLIVLILVWLWLGYEMLYAPMLDDDDKIMIIATVSNALSTNK